MPLFLALAMGCKTSRTLSGSQTSTNQTPGQFSGGTPLWNIREVDDGGDTIVLQSGYKVVDPNSTLLLQLNTEALSQTLAGSALSPDVTDRLKLLKDMLTHEQQAVQDVTEAIAIYNKDPKSPDWGALFRKQKEFVTIIRENYLALYNSLLPATRSHLDEYTTLFRTASAAIAQLEDQILQQAKSTGVAVQLGAWVGTTANPAQTPVHIPDFDDFSPQTAYSVERWQVTLTDEQKQELNDISTLAQKANQQGLGTALLQTFKSSGYLQALDSLPSVKAAIQLQSQLQTLLKSTDSTVLSLKAPIQESYQTLADFGQFITNAVESSKKISDTTSPDALLLQVNNEIGQLKTQLGQLKSVLTTNAQKIISTIKAGAIADAARAKQIAGTFQTLTDGLQAEIDSVQQNATDFFGNLIAGRNVTEQSYDFTSQVRKLSIDALPAMAKIDLLTAGKRSEGDVVTIKLGTSTPAGTVTQRNFVQYRLYFCGLYARTATGFLAVNQAPIFKRVDNSALFRYSPSYSILLKGFWKSPESSRTNLAYHTFWTPGIGINFTTLNFNPNGSIELGIGGVFTLMQDYLQIGF